MDDLHLFSEEGEAAIFSGTIQSLQYALHGDITSSFKKLNTTENVSTICISKTKFSRIILVHALLENVR